ncbi:MAG: hypothetical protein AAFN70_06985, partial [Planctomycetota bacterium]
SGAAEPSADHVIRLIMRHGTNADPRGGALNQIWMPGRGELVVGEEIGDLEIVEIAQIGMQTIDPQSSPGTGCAVPLIGVTVKNNSCRSVAPFHISIVATCGRLSVFSPTVCRKTTTLAPGQCVQWNLPLPARAMGMRYENGHAIEFDRLIVAIDSHDEMIERCESNNIKRIARVALPIQSQAVPATDAAISAAAAAAPGSIANHAGGTDPQATTPNGLQPQSGGGASTATIPGGTANPGMNAAGTVDPVDGGRSQNLSLQR